MLNPARPGNVRHVYQPVDAILDFDKRAKVSQVAHAAVHSAAHLVTIVQGLPGVILNLLHAQTDAPRFRINAQDFNFDAISGINNLAGMLDAFRPAHFGDVYQSLDSTFQLNESAIVRNTRDFSADTRADWKTLFHARPGIRL